MPNKVTWQAPPQPKPTRLDAYLAEWTQATEEPPPLKAMSRARLQQLIEQGAVVVNGKPTRPALKLKGGETIEITVPPLEPSRVDPVAMPLEILLEDSDLIVINKPQGLVVHPGAGTHAPTLVHGLLSHCRDLSGIGGVLRPGIVHRLDRGTSGVIVVAKNDASHEALARQFAQRQVLKRYAAVVLGVPEPRTDTIDTVYGRHPTQRARFTSRLATGPATRRAVTRYRVAHQAGGLSFVDIVLGTGRTHQIRVHLADRGHPVAGDPVYGGRHFTRITDLELRQLATNLPEQALHARLLKFSHPKTGELICLEAPLPPLLQVLANALKQKSGCA